MNLREARISSLLSVSLLISPGTDFTENQTEDNLENTAQITILEKNTEKYQLPLSVMTNFLDFDTNPELKVIFNKIKNDPINTIKIEKSPFIETETIFTIFPENTNDIKHENWSIQIAHDSNPSNKQNTQIAIVIDQNLNYFNGDPNFLIREGSINKFQLFEALAMKSDLTFNFCRKMLETGWDESEKVFENGLSHIVKTYKDREGNIFQQIVRDDSVIIFKANHPLPDFTQKKFEKYSKQAPIKRPSAPNA